MGGRKGGETTGRPIHLPVRSSPNRGYHVDYLQLQWKQGVYLRTMLDVTRGNIGYCSQIPRPAL